MNSAASAVLPVIPMRTSVSGLAGCVGAGAGAAPTVGALAGGALAPPPQAVSSQANPTATKTAAFMLPVYVAI
jgi:hypothetical protein